MTACRRSRPGPGPAGTRGRCRIPGTPEGRAHLHGLRAQRRAAAMPRPSMMPPAAITGMSDGVHALRHQRQGAYLACREIAQEHCPGGPRLPCRWHTHRPHLGPGAPSATVVAVPITKLTAAGGPPWAVSKMPKVKLPPPGAGHQRLELGGKVFAPLRGALGLQASSAQWRGARRSIAACTVASSGLGGLHKQVHAKGPVGLLAYGGSGFGHGGGRAHAAAQHAQPTCGRHGGSQGGCPEPVMGPWMMGNAMPRRWRSEEVMGRLF